MPTPFRVRKPCEPIRAALCGADCTRALARGGVEAGCDTVVAGRPADIGPEAVAPPCCATANAGSASSIVAVIESRCMTEPSPRPQTFQLSIYIVSIYIEGCVLCDIGFKVKGTRDLNNRDLV
jgi:hypothetical protein